MISVWAVMGPSLTGAYWKRVEDGDDYSGPMDDTSFEILNTFVDADAVQPLYKTKTVNGQNPFTIYGMNFPSEEIARDSMNYLDANWPGNQIEIQGAWYIDNGLQMGQSYVIDEETGEVTDEIEGDPAWPIVDDCYKLMPDIVTYDENGDEIVGFFFRPVSEA